MAEPVGFEDTSERDAPRTAQPKATAAKSTAAGGRNYVKADKSKQKSYTKAEMDKFRNNKKKAPEPVKQAWAEAEGLDKDDPMRQDLFESILSAHKGNFDDAMLIVDKTWKRASGIHHTARN